MYPKNSDTAHASLFTSFGIPSVAIEKSSALMFTRKVIFHKKLSSLLVALLFGVALLALGLPTPASADCPPNSRSIIFPNECVLDYPDQSASIGSGATAFKTIDTIDSCNDTFAGVKLSTGYDYISYIRVVGANTSGELKPGQTYSLDISFVQNCRTWTQAYLLTGELQFDSGGPIPLVIRESSFRYREKLTGSIDSYCFTNTCGTATFSSSFTIPNTGIFGPAKLLVTARYNSASASIALPTVSKNWSYTGFLYSGNQTPSIGNSPTPTPTPTPTSQETEIPVTTVEFVETADGGAVCYTPEFTREAVNLYSIIGTKWRVSVNDGSGSQVLDEYLWGLGALPNGDPIRDYTSNGAKTSAYTNGTFLVYAYSVKNQKKGYMYECSVAIRTTKGVGRFNTKYLTATYDTLNFNLVRKTPEPTPSASTKTLPATTKKSNKTITCIKGKQSLKVSGRNPVCPKGYRKK